MVPLRNKRSFPFSWWWVHMSCTFTREDQNIMIKCIWRDYQSSYPTNESLMYSYIKTLYNCNVSRPMRFTSLMWNKQLPHDCSKTTYSFFHSQYSHMTRWVLYSTLFIQRHITEIFLRERFIPYIMLRTRDKTPTTISRCFAVIIGRLVGGTPTLLYRHDKNCLGPLYCLMIRGVHWTIRNSASHLEKYVFFVYLPYAIHGGLVRVPIWSR